MMKGYQKGGMADDMGRALKRKTKDAVGRAMPKRVISEASMGDKMPKMPIGMKKGGKAMKKGK